MKNKKSSYIGGFWFLLVRSPTSPKFKTHKTFVLQSFLWPIYIPIPKLYTILLSSDLKTKKIEFIVVVIKHTSRDKKLKIHVHRRILVLLRLGLQLHQVLKPIRLLFCKVSFHIHIQLYINYICISIKKIKDKKSRLHRRRRHRRRRRRRRRQIKL